MATRGEHTQRLHILLAENDPAFEGISIGRANDKTTWKTSPPSAQAAAQPIIDAFDTSEAAHQAFINSREPFIKELLDSAQVGIQQINDYLLIADAATNVQVRAEVKAIDIRQKKIIQALERLARRLTPLT